MTNAPQEVSEILIAWGRGDKSAIDKLLPLVYEELRRLAHNYMRRENPGHTLQTTALVHEAYMRLVNGNAVPPKDRKHFFAVAATAMRHILTDWARRRSSEKYGGEWRHVPIEEAATISHDRAPEFIALDESLTSLAETHPHLSQAVELSYYAGLSRNQIAETMDVSPETVTNYLNRARAWLKQDLSRN